MFRLSYKIIGLSSLNPSLARGYGPGMGLKLAGRVGPGRAGPGRAGPGPNIHGLGRAWVGPSLRA